MTTTTIFLVFPSERAAVRTFKKLQWIPDEMEFLPPYGHTPDGKSVGFDPLFREGIYMQKTGERDSNGNDVLREKPGYHLNIAWFDGAQLPPELTRVQVFPKTPSCVFA